jgi:O-antigen ligase
MQLLLPSLLTLVPLIIAPYLFFYFDVIPRLSILLIILCGMLLRRDLPAGVAQFYKTQPGRWFCWIAILQCVSLIASTIYSSRPWFSYGGSTWRRYGLLTQLALVLLAIVFAVEFRKSRPQLQACLRAATVSGLAAALYGTLQYFGVDPLLDKSRYHVGEGIWMIVRPPGTLGHADYFGVYLLAVVFASSSLLTMERNQWWRTIAAMTIPVASFAVLLSGTRAALLGLIAGAIFCLLLVRPKMNRRDAAIVLVFAAGITAFYVSPLGLRLKARVRWSSEDPRGGARLVLWRDSLNMAAQRPFLGYGPEMFSIDFPAFQSIELARAYPDFYHESPHNMLLDGFVAQGFPGFGILVSTILLGVIAAFRVSPADRVLAATLLAGFLALILSQQFFSFTVATALCFYFILGALLSLPNIENRSLTVAARMGGKHPTMWRLAAVACSCVFLVYALRLLIADHLMADVSKSIAANDISAATTEYKKVIRWLPPGPAPDLYYSRAMAAAITRVPHPLSSVQAWQQALESGVRAVQSSDEPANAAYSLASLYARKNDAAGVESSLRSAIVSSPNWFKPHWTLSGLLLVQGRLREAEVEATAAIERSKGDNKELLATLQQIRLKLAR